MEPPECMLKLSDEPFYPEFEPRFSVVIATYNQCKFVVEAVRSVIVQSYPAHEIIVVVDGSTDDTEDTLRNSFPGIIVHMQSNSGKCIARNTGIAMATGNWIAFLDHDDLWHRDKLKVTAEYILLHSDCRAINHPLWFFADDERGPNGAYGFKRDFVADTLDQCHAIVSETDPSQNDTNYLNICGNSFASLMGSCRGALSASAVFRDTLLRAGCFPPMQANGEDWTMFLNVARLCEWHTIPRRLGFMRLHSQQDTHQVSGGLIILAGLVNAWYTGRPLRHSTTWPTVLEELSAYSITYRAMVQTCYWSALRQRKFRLAYLISVFGRLLLPRRQDYLYALLPPAITWRWERYVLGMHK